MNYKKYFLFLAIICFAASGFAQTGEEADTLHDAGLMRPSEIVREKLRWNTTSTDLFTSLISSGLYGFYGPQPKIFINGMPVDVNFFGWQNLNMLPIFVNNTYRAVSIFDPQVYHHTPAGAGLINFVSSPLDSGLTVEAFYYTGNETGDPGPWAYDSLKMSPNIDRWGPDRGVFLSYQGSGWYAKGLYINRNHKPKDLAQNLRLHFTNSLLGTNPLYVNHPIFIDSKTGLLAAGFQSKKFSMKARGILAANKDYLFLQPFAREVPAETRYSQFAIQGSFQSGPWKMKGRYIAQLENIDKRVDLHTYIFDWEQLSHISSLSGQYKTKSINIHPGFIYEYMQTDAPGIRNNLDQIISLFLNGSVTLGKGSEMFVHNYLDFHEETIAGSVRLGTKIKAAGGWNINPEIYYSEILPIRQHSFVFWVNRGYNFGNELGISFDRSPRVVENKLLVAKLGNRFSLGAGFTLDVEQQFVHHYALNVPWQQALFNNFTNTRPGTFTITRESGQRFSLLTSLSHHFSSLFQHSLALYLQYTVDGNERYRNYFKQVPETRLQYQFDIHPVESLLISINAVYRSSTKWIELQALDGEQYRLPAGVPIRAFRRTFQAETPSYVNLSLSINKWFWERHISTQISIHNLFNNEVRLHPMGAGLYTKFDFKLSVKF